MGLGWRTLAWGPLVAVTLLGAGCLRNAAFECSSDSECFAGGEEFGFCVDPGYCAFTDPDCPSGQRYGEHAGALGEVCVPPESADGSGTGDSGETDTGETDTGSSTDPDTGESAQPECSRDDDCPSDCFSCEGEQCVPNIGAQASCGECAACNANGDCDPTIVMGQACTSGSVIACQDYVWGEGENGEDWSCYAYADVELTGVCDGLGGCLAPTPADCPNMVGDPLLTCDVGCAKAANTCTQGAPVGQVSLAGFCYLDQVSPQCKDYCNDGSGSTQTQRACDWAGQCKNTGTINCGAYKCDGDVCGTSCQDSGDCAWFHSCVNNECTPN